MNFMHSTDAFPLVSPAATPCTALYCPCQMSCCPRMCHHVDWNNGISQPVTVPSCFSGNRVVCSCVPMPLNACAALSPATSLHGEDFRPYNPFEVKHRKRTTRAQYQLLERTFRETQKPNATIRRWLAQKLSMTPRGVQVWFQNRRAKAKAQQRKQLQQQMDASSQAQKQATHSPSGPSTPEPQPLSKEVGPVDLNGMPIYDFPTSLPMQYQYSKSSSVFTEDDMIKTPTTSPQHDDCPDLNLNPTHMNTLLEMVPLWDASWDPATMVSPPQELVHLHPTNQHELGATTTACTILAGPHTQLPSAAPLEQPNMTNDMPRPVENCWTSAEAIQLCTQPIFDYAFDYNLI